MATWIAHLRIAEALWRDYPVGDYTAFLVGNLGPDCGEPNDDWTAFNPPSEVSHWSENFKKSTINPESFYQVYLTKDWGDFYLGYYIHLQADLIWDRLIGQAAREKYREEFKTIPGFIWTIKEDWYALDKQYVNQHPGWEPLERICQLEDFPNHYVDYYPRGAFNRQMKYICNFYQTYPFHEREFIYLSPSAYEEYVVTAVQEIRQILLQKRQSLAGSL